MKTFLHSMVFEKGCQVRPIAWHRLLEQSGVMRSIFSKIILIIRGRFNKEFCIAAFLFSKNVLRLVRRSGLLFTSLYLKQCNSCLQVAYGGIKRSPELLPVMVSLSRSGYPTIIPSFHRILILRKDDRADQLVQFYLSLFSLYRVTRVAKRVSYKGTFESIVKNVDLTPVEWWCQQLREIVVTLIRRYIPGVSSIPLNQGMSWDPTWKSLPSTARMNEVYRFVMKEHGISRLVSSFPCLVYEMDTYAFLVRKAQEIEATLIHGVLWSTMVRYALDPMNTLITDLSYTDSLEKLDPWPCINNRERNSPIFGRLGQSIEGGGKRRIFAIGNYLNQRMLRPVHDWLMKVLKSLSTDGTFNQDGPLKRLIGEQDCFCYDLKAATDRWPLLVLHEVLTALFESGFSASVIWSLAFNHFEVPFVNRRGDPSRIFFEEERKSYSKINTLVSFVVGQPLGYYASWPLFALSHHIMIWWCAEQVYPGRRFERYAVLGDDVVITDPKVASTYLVVLNRLQVQVSMQKSLISNTGAAEFAKRFRVKGLTKDISPISAKALMMFFNPFGLIAIGMKYNCKATALIRIGGGGYRRLARLDKPNRFSAMLNRALLGQGKYELWLGRGLYLQPHVKAEVRRLILRKMKPKDITPPPIQLFDSKESYDFLEYTQLRSWMDMWLTCQKWYTTVSNDFWVPLDDLFEGPYCPNDWRLNRKDNDLIRFGLLWRLYDMVLPMIDSCKVPILCESSPLSGWLFGGIDGTEFLVWSRGLVQPRAHCGINLPGITYSGTWRDLKLCNTPIHYKTLGVSDRQVLMDFERSVNPILSSYIERQRKKRRRAGLEKKL